MARYLTSLVYFFLSTSFTEAGILKSLTLRGLDEYYNEDGVGNVLVDQTLAQLTDFAAQCMDAHVMNAIDPVASMLDKFEDYCTDSQATEFESTLTEYNDCTGTSLSDFIETFWSASVGMSMTCGPYVYRTAMQIANSFASNSVDELPEISFDRMPDECVNSLMGDNPFGNFYREHTINPGKDRECLAKLGRHVPDCTLRRWPVPIVGYILKFYSCAENKVAGLMDQSCSDEVRKLSSCLPSTSEIKGASVGDAQCQSVFKRCTVDYASVFMYLPSPLSAAPLSDTCARADISHDVFTRLEAYQNACSSDADRAIWRQSSVGVATFSRNVFGSHAQSTKENNSSGSSTTIIFFLGISFGIVCTIGVAWFIKRKTTQGSYLVGEDENSDRQGIYS